MQKTSYSYSQIWTVAYPMLLTMLVQNLIQVIDTAFLGRMGEVELGASAIAGIYYVVLFTVAFGFSSGSQILIGRRNGEKNWNRIGEIVIWGILFLWILSGIVFLFTRTASPFVLNLILDSDKILNACIEYLDWRIFGLFFASVNVMFRAFFVGITKTKVLSFNAILMALTNVFFDYCLIFGNLGFPEMGIAGAALASVIAEAISVLFFVVYLIVAVDWKKYGFNLRIFENLKIIRHILNISSSLMLQYLLSFSTWFIFFVAIEKMGEMTLAVSNIVRSCYMIIGIPIYAFGATTNTLVSNSIGAGKQEEVPNLMWKISKFSLSVIGVFIFFLALFPRLAISVYTSDLLLIEQSVPSLYVILGVLPVMAIAQVLFSGISGSGNTRSALGIESITLIIYVFWMWLMAIHLQAPLAVCWTTELVYGLFLGIFSFIYFKRGNWKDRKI